MPLDSAIPDSAVPTQIKRRTDAAGEDSAPGTGIEISWSTGENFFLPSMLLRRHCPCATCLEQGVSAAPDIQSGRSRLAVVTTNSEAQCDLLQVLPVGNYAVSLIWGDMHDTGIYTFDALRELCCLGED